MPRKVTNNVIAGATVTNATSKVDKKPEIIMPADKDLKAKVADFLEAHIEFKRAKSDLDIRSQSIRAAAQTYLNDESIKEKKCIGSFFIETDLQLHVRTDKVDKKGNPIYEERDPEERVQIVPSDKFSVITADPKSLAPEDEINAKLDAIEEIFPGEEFDSFIEQQTTYSLKPEFVELLETDEDVRKEFNKLLVNEKFKILLQNKGYNQLDSQGNSSLIVGTVVNKVKKGGLDLIFSKGKAALNKLLDTVKLSDFAIKVGAKK